MVVLLVNLFLIYLVLGLLFAIPFVWKGVQQIDAAAAGTSVWFKLIILPGCVAFWPLLLRKWINARKS